MLCTTLAVSGIRFAATRIVAEEIGSGREGAVGTAVFRCCMYSLLFGCTAAAVLMSFAEPVGFLWIGDARTVMSLRILACGLPFLSLSSVLSGYFTACGRVWKSALVHLIEQLSYIGLVALFLSRTPQGVHRAQLRRRHGGYHGLRHALVRADVAFFLSDRRAHAQRSARSERLTARMLGVALPLAVSSYARSALSTLEHMLVPRGPAALRALGGQRPGRIRRHTGHGHATHQLSLLPADGRGGADRARADGGPDARRRRAHPAHRLKSDKRSLLFSALAAVALFSAGRSVERRRIWLGRGRRVHTTAGAAGAP